MEKGKTKDQEIPLMGKEKKKISWEIRGRGEKGKTRRRLFSLNYWSTSALNLGKRKKSRKSTHFLLRNEREEGEVKDKIMNPSC